MTGKYFLIKICFTLKNFIFALFQMQMLADFWKQFVTKGDIFAMSNEQFLPFPTMFSALLNNSSHIHL